jgi:hypothetical protein
MQVFQTTEYITLIECAEFIVSIDFIEETVVINPFTASCENAMTPSVPGILESCEKFPHSSQLNF